MFFYKTIYFKKANSYGLKYDAAYRLKFSNLFCFLILINK